MDWKEDLQEDVLEQRINGNKDEVHWYEISRYQKLSEKFIEKHKDKVDWDIISRYQELSESFIEKHKDKVSWDNISYYQKLSEEFIEKHNLIDVYKLSEEQIEVTLTDERVSMLMKKFAKILSKTHSLPNPLTVDPK